MLAEQMPCAAGYFSPKSRKGYRGRESPEIAASARMRRHQAGALRSWGWRATIEPRMWGIFSGAPRLKAGGPHAGHPTTRRRAAGTRGAAGDTAEGVRQKET